jgi:phosphatidylglycerophosphatase A
MVGFIRYFPGTLSSLLVLGFYEMIKSLDYASFFLIFIIFITYSFFSVPFFEKKYGKDPSCYTFDELIGTYLLLFIIYNYDFNVMIGFVLWRIIDIYKPFYIKKLQNLKGAYGVVLDDLAAVGVTCLLLWVFKISIIYFR